MSYTLMRAVEQSSLGRREKSVARVLASFATDDGRCIYPRIQRVAEMSGYCERSVQTAARRLCAAGVLEVVVRRGPHRATEYRFHVHALPGCLPARCPQPQPAKAALK